MALARRLTGLALALGAVALAWWVYPQIGGWIRALPQRWMEVPLRGIVNDHRLVLEVLAVFLALSALDWIWRKTLGRENG